MKKLFKIAGQILFYGFLLLSAVMIIASFTMKKSTDDALTIFGMQARIVRSDSMEKSPLTDVSKYDVKSIPVKSLVFIEVVPEDEAKAQEWFADLEVGDVLTFRYVYNGQITITHRIIEIEEKANGRILTLEGDNKNASTNLMKQTLDTSEHFNLGNYNYTIGKVKGKSYILGLFIYALNTPVGMLCIVVVPCVIVILMEIIKIVNVMHEEKEKKLTSQQESKDAEIELLKQQLADLQASVKAKSEEETPQE